MTDLERAKKLLLDEDLTLAVVKDREVIFKSKDKGIKPIYTLVTEFKEEGKGATLVDRVIGRGAAILIGYLEIKEVYSELISRGGLERLEYYNISYSMDRSCEYIKNRDKTDYCPIEKISSDINDPIELIKAIEGFFNKIKKDQLIKVNRF